MEIEVIKNTIPRAEHNISRVQISENALKVMYRLKNAGFEALLVGGGVRDLLLSRTPKDFDVSTDATPEEVKHLFRNCRLIGRRFRLAHVHFGPEIIEVATFRGQHEGDQGEEGQIVNGMIVRDNVYGSLEEDACRRDFTVNSLYYDIKDFSVVDYVGGIEDLRARRLRLIGDPEQRYREDPVRMLRAIRFAAKLDFSIEPESEKPLSELAFLLEGVPPARLFEEILKLFLSGDGLKTFLLLRRYDLFGQLFPQTEEGLSNSDSQCLAFLSQALKNTDERIASGKPVTPAFIFAVFLWSSVKRLASRYIERGMSDTEVMAAASDAVLSGQNQRVAIPRRFHMSIKEIWQLQDRLSKRAPKRSFRLLKHPRFRAGYDFLLLRADVDSSLRELADWWTHFQEGDENSREDQLKSVGPRRRGRSGRRDRSAAKSD